MERFPLRCIFATLTVTLALTAPLFAQDGDADGVSDAADNCLAVPNPAQVDSDGDGCGNACDADYDQSGMVDSADFNFFRSVMGRRNGEADFRVGADHNADGRISGADFIVFRKCMNRAPGPSLVVSRDREACP